jgi:hypothetical protein
MVTRKERIDAFSHEGVPPTDLPLELLCEDHVGTYVIPFLCRWNTALGIVLTPTIASKRRLSAGACVDVK